VDGGEAPPAGRSKAHPGLCIVDTRSVACIAVAGPRGYDAGKKVMGRKLVAMTDADGHPSASPAKPRKMRGAGQKI
jgi:putative transposase